MTMLTHLYVYEQNFDLVILWLWLYARVALCVYIGQAKGGENGNEELPEGLQQPEKNLKKRKGAPM